MTEPVFLVGRNDFGRSGLVMVLANEGLEVVSLTDDARKLVAHGAQPHVAVIDFQSLDRAIEAVGAMKERFPEVFPVVLDRSFDFGSMVQCFEAGAHGYILKAISGEQLAAALRLVALGQKVMPSNLADLLPPPLPVRHENGPELGRGISTDLSNREQNVLSGIREGHANKVIARQLEVSEATIKVHVKSILRKLNVDNRTQAAVWAISHDLDSSKGLPAP